MKTRTSRSSHPVSIVAPLGGRDSTPPRSDPYAWTRSLGRLAGSLKVGPAARVSTAYQALVRVGVLQRSPDSWADSPRVARMPWGAEPLDAPPPELPAGLEGPWPQRAVVDPSFYAPVLNVPPEDLRDHVDFTVTRYLGQLVEEVPAAILRALRGPRLVEVSDDELASILTETSLGQFVSRALTARDRALFGGVLSGDEASFATLDFSFVPTEDLLPGMYAAPVVALVRRAGPRWQVIALAVDGRVVGPREGDLWRFAKCFALQGAQLRLVSSTHPRLHFPGDVIHAITRTAVPAWHPLQRLVRPHTRFTLGLHKAVIHHRRSSIHNSQREMYNPFPYASEGMHKMVASGNTGVPGNPAWPAYRFDDNLFGEHVPYGRYRREWFDAWEDFAHAALASVKAGDAVVRRWADQITAWLPGFPSGEAIFEGRALARSVASYLCAVTTFHTGDHHSYATIAMEKMPWRLRAPFATRAAPGSFDPDALVSPEDTFRAHLAYALFFKPAVITSLRDARYDLDARGMRAVRDFHARMDTLDRRWQGTSFPSSYEIASSLQY